MRSAEHADSSGPSSARHDAVQPRERPSLPQTARMLRDALDHRTRVQAVASIALALFAAVVSAVGFGLLYPLLQTVSAGKAPTSGAAGVVYEFFGSPGYNDFVMALAATVITLLLLGSVLGVVLLRWQTNIVANSEATMASRLFDIYMSTDYLDHIRRNSAELIRNVHHSVMDIHAQVVLPALTIFCDLLAVTIVVIVVASISPVTAAVAVAYFFVVSFVFARVISPPGAGTRSAEPGPGAFTHQASPRRAHWSQGVHGVPPITASSRRLHRRACPLRSRPRPGLLLRTSAAAVSRDRFARGHRRDRYRCVCHPVEVKCGSRRWG